LGNLSWGLSTRNSVVSAFRRKIRTHRTRTGSAGLDRSSYGRRYHSKNVHVRFHESICAGESTRFSVAGGGPLVRNKAFVFGTFEYNRQNSVRIIALPAANPFAGEYNGTYDNGNRSKLGQAKLDYTANSRHAFSARYLYDNDDIVEDYELAENTALDFSDVSASWNWTLGASTLNSMVVQYLDQDTQRFQLTPDTQVIRPSFTSGRSPNLPQGFPRNRLTFNDTFFWSTGRHSTKAGVRMATVLNAIAT